MALLGGGGDGGGTTGDDELIGRQAVQPRDWPTVGACAERIMTAAPDDPEGHFLMGLHHKAANRPLRAAEAFERTLTLNAERYDAAIELAGQYSVARRNAEAASRPDLGEIAGWLPGVAEALTATAAALGPSASWTGNAPATIPIDAQHPGHSAASWRRTPRPTTRAPTPIQTPA